MPRSRFSTAIKKYSIQSEALVFPMKFGPVELNKTIKNLLKENDIDASDVNFNFFINGDLLTVSLSEFIESKSISEEIEEIIYDIDMEPPKLDKETKTEEFITGMKINSNWIVTACFGLQIFDMRRPESPVVEIVLDIPMLTVDWVSLCEEKHEGVIVAGGERGKMGMWRCNLDTGAADQIFELKGHVRDIGIVAVSSDGTLVASGSHDGLVKVWSTSDQVTDLSVETGGIPHVSKNKCKVPTRIPLVTISAHNSAVCDIKWLASDMAVPSDVLGSGATTASDVSVTGNLLTCGSDHYVKLWHVAGLDNTSLVREIKSNSPCNVLAVGGAHDLVVTGSMDNRLRMYDMRAPIAEVSNLWRAHTAMINCVRWCPANTNLLATADIGGTTKLWDARRLKDPLMLVSKFEASVTFCDWSADGQLLATAYDDGALRFYRFNL